MQFCIERSAKGAERELPRSVRGGRRTEIKDQKPGTNYICTAVYIKPIQNPFVLKVNRSSILVHVQPGEATVTHVDRLIL